MVGAGAVFIALPMLASSRLSSTERWIFSKLFVQFGDTGLSLSRISYVVYRMLVSVSLFSLQTEYKYCYDLVLHYVLHYLNKDLKELKEKSK